MGLFLRSDKISIRKKAGVVLNALALFGQVPGSVALSFASHRLRDSMPLNLAPDPLLLELEIYGCVLILTRSIQKDEGVRGHILWNEEDKISCCPCRTARNIYSATK